MFSVQNLKLYYESLFHPLNRNESFSITKRFTKRSIQHKKERQAGDGDAVVMFMEDCRVEIKREK